MDAGDDREPPTGGGDVLARARSLLASHDEPTRLTGVHTLRDGDGDPAPRAEVLIPVLADSGSYVPHAARAALQTLGEAALPALFRGLASAHTTIRVGCAWALAMPQGERACEVVDALRGCGADDARDVRHAVAAALGRVGVGLDTAAPLLSTLACDAETRVRAEALESLGRLGGRDERARGLLLDGLDDPRVEVRAAATAALRRVAAWPALATRVQTALEDEPAPRVADDLRALLEELGNA